MAAGKVPRVMVGFWKRGLGRLGLVMAAWSLLAHVLAAWLQDGFHNCDEYFQVVGLAALKLGRTTPDVLPWEFHEQMRPFFQPVLLLLQWAPLRALGVESPFVWLQWSRLWGGLVGWAVMWALVAALAQRWSAWRRGLLTVLVGGSWFLPYFNVRTSSESLAALLFHGMLLAVALGVARRDARTGALLLLGLLGGLTFQARYQAGTLTAGVLLWASWQCRAAPVRPVGWMFLGMLAGLAVGQLADVWGYGDWGVLAPVNYVVENVVEDKASGFGTSPWWDYLPLSLFSQGPAGPVLLVVLLAFWLRFPGHVVTWATLPFVLLHVVVPHKEGRFLFPVVVAQSVALALATPGRWVRWPVLRFGVDRVRVVAGLAVAAWVGFNAAGMFNATLLVHSPKVAALRLVFAHPEWPVVWAGQDPRESCGGLSMTGLQHPNATFVRAANAEAPVTAGVVPQPRWWAVRVFDEAATPVPRGSPCRRVWRTLLSAHTLQRALGPLMDVIPRARQRQDVEVFQCTGAVPPTPPPAPATPPAPEAPAGAPAVAPGPAPPVRVPAN